MTVTKVLQEQTGIQYQGVTDKSEADPRDGLLNAIMAGQFKRGRLDKPFQVTKANYRAQLGYEPENKDFVAVEDALADGAPFVWVQRVRKFNPDDVLVSCEILTNEQILAASTYNITEPYTPEIGIVIDAIDIGQNIAVGSSVRSALDLIQGVRLHFIWVSNSGDKVRFEVNIPNLTDILKTQDPVNYAWWLTTYTVDFKDFPEIHAKLSSLFTPEDLALVAAMKLDLGFQCIEQQIGGQSKLMITPWMLHKLIINPFKAIDYDGMVYNALDICYKKSDRIIAVDWEKDKFSTFQEVANRMPLRFGQNESTYWATIFDPYIVARS